MSTLCCVLLLVGSGKTVNILMPFHLLLSCPVHVITSVKMRLDLMYSFFTKNDMSFCAVLRQYAFHLILDSVAVRLLLYTLLHRTEVTELMIHDFITLTFTFYIKSKVIYVLYIYCVPWNDKNSVPSSLKDTKQKSV